MTIKEFKEILREELLKILPNETEVTLVCIPKTNGIKLEALTIHSKNEECAPVIYLEEYYFNFNNGKPIFEIANEIALFYESNRVNAKLDFDYLKDYSFVKSRVFFRVVNKEINTEYLADKIYKEFLDLVILFCCDTTDLIQGFSSFTITQNMFSLWDVSLDTLFDDAYRNTKEIRPFIKLDIMDMIRRIKPCDFGLPCDSDMNADTNAIVCTNKENLFGASYMIYTDLLKEHCEEIDSDVVVIPASVNEIILIPENNIDKLYVYSQMVNEVSSDVLNISEVLSYHAYYFSREHGYISKSK